MKNVPPIHGDDHRPPGWLGATDPGGPDPLNWLTRQFGNPFCYARTDPIAVSGPTNNGSWTPDLEPGGSAGTEFFSNSDLLSLVEDPDPTNTPQWGVLVPANYLARVTTSLAIFQLSAAGQHVVTSRIDGSYTVSNFGPAWNSDFTKAASSESGLTDAHTAPEGLYSIRYLGDTSDWIVGVGHTWDGFTDDPKDFYYEISVELVGTLPT